MKLLAALTALALAGCSGEGADAEASKCGPSSGKVKRVIDGDTIELEDGTRIRYLLIDAPETDTCFGSESTLYNQELVDGRQVGLGYDVECTDDYGRTLAYVTVQSREVNTLMVERGFACSFYVPPNGKSRRTEFDGLEAKAKAELKGMWGKGVCAEVSCD